MELTMKTFIKGAGIASSFLLAATTFANTAQQTADNNYFQSNGPTANSFYVGANVNYTHADWKDMITSKNPYEPSYDAWKNGTGGLGFGLFGGYLFNKVVSVEAGYYHAPTTEVTIHVNNPNPDTKVTAIKISDNMLYAAVALSAPFPGVKNLGMYAKVGPGMQLVHINKTNGVLNSVNSLGLYASLGVSYYVGNHISMSLSASGISGHSDHSGMKYATNVYIYGLSANYSF